VPRLTDLAPAQPHLTVADGLVDKLVSGHGQATLAPAEASKAKASAQVVLSNITELNRQGNPTNPIDARIAAALRANRQTILDDIRAASAQGKPSPLDYYETYVKVLKDSGLLMQALPDPQQLREAARGFEARRGFSPFGDGPLVAEECSSCKACHICEACTICAICEATAVIGTGAVGGVTGLGGAIADFF
jgi:hypothetical protein